MLPPFGPPSIHVFSASAPRLGAWRKFFEGFAERRVPHTLRWGNVQAWTTVNNPEEIYAEFETDNIRTLANLVAIVDLSDLTASQFEALSLDQEPDKDQQGDSALERHTGGLRPPELVLRYPEVYWIFIVPSMPRGYPSTTAHYHFVSTDELSRIVDLLQRHGKGFRTWFDCTGLRELLRRKTATAKAVQSSVAGAASSDICPPGVSLDEETGHCIFNGYVLYRNRRRTFLVNSLAEMKAVLMDADLKNAVVIEDIELQFDDAHEGVQPAPAIGEEGDYAFLATVDGGNVRAMLAKRLETFPLLKSAQARKDRILVSGIENPGAFGAVSKPLSGMFDERLSFLWRIAGAQTQFGRIWQDIMEWAGDVRLGFKMLGRQLNAKSKAGQQVAFKRHSATYRRQHVAERLLARARDLAPTALSVESAVHVAMLAREAKLLLDDENFTLSLEAIGIQHRMEVLAECVSPGGAASLSAPVRFWFLRRAINRVTTSHRKRHNAMVSITNDLHATYEARSQHQAADEALDRLRVHRWHLAYGAGRLGFAWWPLYAVLQLVAVPARVLGLLVNRIAGGVVEAYFNFLMRSFTNILLACAMWIGIFAVGYENLVRCAPDSMCERFDVSDWVMHSSATFLALQPGLSGQPEVMLPPPPFNRPAPSMGAQTEDPDKPQEDVPGTAVVMASSDSFRTFWLITIFEMIFGFVHLGVLVSFLFQRLTR